MKLINSQIIALAEAHLNLDGTPEKPFKFPSRLRYGLAKNLRLLQQRVRDIETARMNLIREIAPGSLRIENDTPEVRVFEDRYKAIMDTEVEIPNLMQIKLSELGLDQNDIPVRVLSTLGPIIQEDVDFA